MANEIKADDIFDSKGFDDIANNFDKVITKLKSFITEVENAADAIKNKLGKEAKELSKNDYSKASDIAKHAKQEAVINQLIQKNILLETQRLKLVKELSNAETKKQKVIDIAEKARKASANSEQADLAKRQKAIEQQRLADIRLQQQREKAFDAYEKNLAKQMQDEKKAEQQRRKLNSEYNKTQIQLTRLNRVLRDLQTKQVKGIQLTEKEIAFVTKYTKVQKDLDTTLKKVDADLGINIRTVGRYTESIKDAIGASGLLNNEVGELGASLAQVGTNFKNARNSGASFGSALKGGIVGAVLAAGVAIAKFASQSQSFIDSTSLAWARFKDQFSGTNDFVKLVEASIAFRDEQRNLRLSIQAVSQDAEDFNEISQDITLGFKTREKFAQKALDAELKRGKLNVDLAQKQLSLVTQEIEARGRNAVALDADNELLEKENELILNLKDAEDALNDTRRLAATRLREIQQKELKQTINVIQSEADLRNEFIQKQIENEKKQLNERILIANSLNEYNQKVFEREISQFDKILDVKIDGNKLLQISNAELLQQEIDALDLGEKAQKELLDIITKRQQSYLKFQEDKIKLDEAEIALGHQLRDTQEELFLNSKKFQLEDQQEAFDLAVKTNKENLDLLFEDENVFNNKKLKLRKVLVKEEIEARNQLEQQQRELLLFQKQNDERIAENTIPEKELLAAEKLKIEQKYLRDVEQLNKEALSESISDNQKALAEKEAIAKKQIQIIAQDINKILDAATNAQSKKFEQINSNIEKEIERNNTALDSQRARAEQGLSNELAFRQAQSDKLALVQEREKKRQEKSQELLAYLKLFTGYAEQNPDKALQFTLRDMALMTAGKMLYANEGNEFVSADGKTKSIFKPFAKGADVVPAMLAEGERVVTKDKNIKYNEALHAIHNDKFNEMYLPKSVLENGKKSTGFAESALNSMLLNGLINVNSETNNRIANLEKAILSKEHTNFSWNEIYGGIQKEVEKAGKKTTTIYKVSKPRIN